MPLIDLTYTIKEDMLTFNAPWHSSVSINQMGTINHEGRETKKITLGTHTGTHIDAPLHFIGNGLSIDEIPLEKLFGNVSIIDYSFLKQNEPVTKAMLEEIDVKKRMIFKFGWGKYWNTGQFYQDYPYFTKKAAKYLISSGIELIAMDTPSPDDSHLKMGSERDSEVHKKFLKNGVVILEYLANLDKLNNFDGWKIIAMPLKIKNADGSPARVLIYK